MENKKELMEAIDSMPLWELNKVFENLSDENKNDRELAEKAINKYGTLIKYFSDEIKNDKELGLKAVEFYHESFYHCGDIVKNDFDVNLAYWKGILEETNNVYREIEEAQDKEQVFANNVTELLDTKDELEKEMVEQIKHCDKLGLWENEKFVDKVYELDFGKVELENMILDNIPTEHQWEWEKNTIRHDDNR